VNYQSGKIERDRAGRKHFFFVNKKEAKKTSLLYPVRVTRPLAQLAKVFCFFFSKKKRLLPYFSDTLTILRRA
jgi:hypothetical protein